MVDRERVLRLLNRIERDVGVLAGLAAIEGCAKVAHHLAAAEGWPVSDSNGEAVRRLGDRGVLDPALISTSSDSSPGRSPRGSWAELYIPTDR